MSLNYVERIIDVFLNNHLFAANYYRLNDPIEGYYINRNSPLSEQLKNKIKYRKHNYRICSLTKVDNNKLMWAHYSKGFTGVVIGLKTDEMVHKVNYRKLFELNKFCQGELTDLKPIFLHKLIEWKYEKESRIVINDKRAFFDIKPLELIFGLRVDKKTKGNLIKMIRKINDKVIFKQQNINFENQIINQ